jgi:predicted ATPase
MGAEFVRIGPYQIVAALGQGGMGEIYRARDDRLEREVVLKLLGERFGEDPGAVEQLITEARAASALNHPNIVTIHEVGEEAGRRFIVMELVNGRTLRELQSEPWALDRFNHLCRQIAHALAAAHAAGVVHRDIKPENVMVRDDGYVKVVDFGIARRVPAASSHIRVTTGAPIYGTPRYMSPEQIVGDRITSKSDIFSLGVVAYEWAAGKNPFAAENVLDEVTAIRSTEPPRPSLFNPEIPPALDALILEMIQKDPDRRPAAIEVADRLAAMTARLGSVFRGDAVAFETHPLVGRDAEAAALRAALDDIARGRSVVVGVAGEPGIGKTTLIEHVLQELAASEQAYFVARGRCSERLAGTEAYLPFLEAFDSLLRGRGRDTVVRLLKSAAPAWYSQLTDSDGTRTATDAVSQERLKRQLLAVLEEICRLRPLVLFFDDMHWADASTVDLLSYVAARFDRLRVLVIASYRPADLQLARHPFLQVMRDLASRGHARQIEMTFLDRGAIAAYLDMTFPQHTFPPDLAGMIHQRTEGNPLFMVGVVDDLRSRDVIVRRGGRWELAGDLPEIAGEVPPSIRSLIQRKIDALDDEQRQLLLAASVQGVQFDTAVVARALNADPAAVEDELDRLERAHAFVRLAGAQALPSGVPSSQYRFQHALYQNTLYQSIRPVRRAALSGLVAESLAMFHAADTGPISADLALLFEAAGACRNAAKHFLAAARRATDVFAYHEPIVLARRGLRMVEQMPDSAEKRQLELDLQLTLGLALTATRGYAAADVEQTFTRARELCAQTDDATRLFRVLESLWGFYFVKADLVRSTEIIAQMLELAAASGNMQHLAIAHQSFGFPLLHGGRFGEGLDHMEQALALDDSHQRQPLTASITRVDVGVRSLAWSSLLLWLVGRSEEGEARLLRAQERASRLAHPFTQGFASSLAAWFYQYERKPAEVLRHAEAALGVSVEHGLGQWVPVSLVLRGWALAEQGQVPNGIKDLEKGLGIYDRTGAALNKPHFLSMLAEARARAGEHHEALGVLDDARAIAEHNQDVCWMAELCRLTGVLKHAVSATDEAETWLRKAIAVAQSQGAPLLEQRAMASLAELRA